MIFSYENLFRFVLKDLTISQCTLKLSKPMIISKVEKVLMLSCTNILTNENYRHYIYRRSDKC